MVIKEYEPSKLNIVVSDIDVTVSFKNVKNIRITVAAPTGRVSVSAPFGTSLSSIKDLVASRAEWIKQKQIEITNSVMSRADSASAEEVNQWKAVVSACVPPLVRAWEPILGVKVHHIVYRNMKSRWGSCQPSTGKVCINTRLALFPPECLEFVVVHEMCHLLVPHHGREFKELLNRVMPDWKKRYDLLRK